MEYVMLKQRKDLEKKLTGLKKAVKRKKGEKLKSIKWQIKKVFSILTDKGGFLNMAEKEKLREVKQRRNCWDNCDNDDKKNFLRFNKTRGEKRMKKMSRG